MEGSTILSQKRFTGELYSGIISVQPINGIPDSVENILLVALKDSSVLAIEVGTGNQLSTTSIVRPKKPAKALYIDVLGNEAYFSGFISKLGVLTSHSPKQMDRVLCIMNFIRVE